MVSIIFFVEIFLTQYISCCARDPSADWGVNAVSFLFCCWRGDEIMSYSTVQEQEHSTPKSYKRALHQSSCTRRQGSQGNGERESPLTTRRHHQHPFELSPSS